MSRVVLIVLLIAGVGLALAWPRIDIVETGRTPEYQDLQPRDYAKSEDAVGKAARAAVGRLPGWTMVGGGKGAGGTALQAKAGGLVSAMDSEVTIRVKPHGKRTRVEVRSQTPSMQWDLGQNARVIRAFYAALDEELGH
jgi:hypothetical protein